MNLGKGLLVGVNRYDHITDLRYCTNDAEALAQTIGESKAFSATKKNLDIVTSETDPRPTRAVVMAQLAESLAGNSVQDGFLFYFAGHGIEIDGNPFLLPEDFDPQLPELTAISVADLMSAIRRKNVARRVIILDSCYSGIHRGERAASDEAFEAFQRAFGHVFDPSVEGAAVLSSASINEKARERIFDKNGHGVFTHSLIQSIRSLQKTVSSGGDVTIEQVHASAYRETVLQSNGNQHPRFFYSVGLPITVFKAVGSAKRSDKVADDEKKATVPVTKALRNVRSQNRVFQQDGIDVLVEYSATGDLIELLAHGRPEVRELAASGLARLKATEAIPHLIDGLRLTGVRDRKPVIPRAEEFLAEFGEKALSAILARVDDNIHCEEKRRWTKALKSAVDSKGVRTLLKHAQSNTWLLEAALTSGQRITKRDVLPVIEAYVHNSKGDLNQYSCESAAEWISKSSCANLPWAKKLIENWNEEIEDKKRTRRKPAHQVSEKSLEERLSSDDSVVRHRAVIEIGDSHDSRHVPTPYEPTEYRNKRADLRKCDQELGADRWRAGSGGS